MKKIKRLIVCSLVLGLSLFIGKEEVSAQQGLSNLSPWMSSETLEGFYLSNQNIYYLDLEKEDVCCIKLEYPKGTLKLLNKYSEGTVVNNIFAYDLQNKDIKNERVRFEEYDENYSLEDFVNQKPFKEKLEDKEQEEFIVIDNDFLINSIDSMGKYYTKISNEYHGRVGIFNEYINKIVPESPFKENNFKFTHMAHATTLLFEDKNNNGYHDVYLNSLNNNEKSYAVRTADKDILVLKLNEKINFEYNTGPFYVPKHFYNYIYEDTLLNREWLNEKDSKIEDVISPLFQYLYNSMGGMDKYIKKEGNKLYSINNLIITEGELDIPLLLDYSKYSMIGGYVPKIDEGVITNFSQIIANSDQVSFGLRKAFDYFDNTETSNLKEVLWKNIEIAKDEVLTREDLLKAMSYNFKDFYTINTDAIQFYTKVKVKEESGSGMDWSPAVYEEASIEDILPINFSELNEEDLEKFKEATIVARLSQEDINNIGGESVFRYAREFKLKVVDAGLGKVYKGYDTYDWSKDFKFYRTLEEATNKECICEREMTTPPPPAPEEPEDPIEPEPAPPEEPRSEIPPTYPTYELPEVDFSVPPNPPITEEKPRIDIVVPPNPPIVNEKPKGEIPPEPPKPNTPPPVTPPKEDEPKDPPKKTNEMPKTNLDSNLNLLIFSEAVFLVFFVGNILKQKRED